MSKIITIGSKIATSGDKIMAKVFSPADISNLKLWLEPENIEKDGSDYVSKWIDSSGNGFDLEQSTQASKPLWVDNELNGQPVIRFDGTNDFLDVDFGQDFTQPNTVFIIWKISSSATISGVGCYTANISWDVSSFFMNVSNVLTIMNGTQRGVVNDEVRGNFKLHSAVSNGANSMIFQDGINLVTGNSGTNSMNRFRLGEMMGFGWWLDGDVAEVIFYNALLTDAQRIAVENYLIAKYNL
jgi:hypothetical protein